MVSRRSLPALWVLLGLLSAYSTARADQVDNPLYKAWASYKVESNKTLSATLTVGAGIEVKNQITATLKAVADDHVTVEIVSSSTVNGQSHQGPPRSENYPAKIDDKSLQDGGSDTVAAMGKTFNCKVLTVAGTAAGTVTARNAKVWVSDGVPGGVVKIEASGARPGGPPTTMTWIITAFETK
jgi:hypothetical protein